MSSAIQRDAVESDIPKQSLPASVSAKRKHNILNDKIKIPFIPIALPIWIIGATLIAALAAIIFLNVRQNAYKKNVRKAAEADKEFIKKYYNTFAVDAANQLDQADSKSKNGVDSSTSHDSAADKPLTPNEELQWDEVPSQILPSLVLTGRRGMMRFVELSKHSRSPVTHVISLTASPVEIDSSLLPSDRHLRIQINDVPSADIYQHFGDILNFVKQAMAKYNDKALIVVHCEMGISRSASAVLAILMYNYNMDLDSALDFLKSKRPIVNPNSGFMEQLNEFESFLKKSE
jgi:protein-tyrosine phosphatase